MATASTQATEASSKETAAPPHSQPMSSMEGGALATAAADETDEQSWEQAPSPLDDVLHLDEEYSFPLLDEEYSIPLSNADMHDHSGIGSHDERRLVPGSSSGSTAEEYPSRQNDDSSSRGQVREDEQCSTASATESASNHHGLDSNEQKPGIVSSKRPAEQYVPSLAPVNELPRTKIPKHLDDVVKLAADGYAVKPYCVVHTKSMTKKETDDLFQRMKAYGVGTFALSRESKKNEKAIIFKLESAGIRVYKVRVLTSGRMELMKDHGILVPNDLEQQQDLLRRHFREEVNSISTVARHTLGLVLDPPAFEPLISQLHSSYCIQGLTGGYNSNARKEELKPTWQEMCDSEEFATIRASQTLLLCQARNEAPSSARSLIDPLQQTVMEQPESESQQHPLTVPHAPLGMNATYSSLDSSARYSAADATGLDHGLSSQNRYSEPADNGPSYGATTMAGSSLVVDARFEGNHERDGGLDPAGLEFDASVFGGVTVSTASRPDDAPHNRAVEPFEITTTAGSSVFEDARFGGNLGLGCKASTGFEFDASFGAGTATGSTASRPDTPHSPTLELGGQHHLAAALCKWNVLANGSPTTDSRHDAHNNNNNNRGHELLGGQVFDDTHREHAASVSSTPSWAAVASESWVDDLLNSPLLEDSYIGTPTPAREDDDDDDDGDGE